VAKVTSKLQVTIPKALAERYGIKPGDEIEWVAAGETIRVVPAGRAVQALDARARLRLFDVATARQRSREGAGRATAAEPRTRGWRREELYRRDRAR
jgi:AbrB family looped-hinge helix DNA binding protein